MVAFDNLGVQRFESARIQHSAYGMTMLAEKLPTAFSFFRDNVVLRPQLTQEQLENSQSTILQEIEAIEDHPAQKLFIDLRRRAAAAARPADAGDGGKHRGADGRTRRGGFTNDATGRKAPSSASAGAVEFAAVRDLVARHLGDLDICSPIEAPDRAVPGGHGHIKGDKVQTHLGISFPSGPLRPRLFNAHGAIGVLGGGMSSRLFSEVREKRGLCYSVSASYHPLRLGFVLCYAGTTNERAAETATVMMAELRRLADGVAEDEVQRVRAGLKASLVISEESTTSRAAVLRGAGTTWGECEASRKWRRRSTRSRRKGSWDSSKDIRRATSLR